MSYFEQSKLGESRWWSWVIVTWLTFAGWVIFQFILLTPLPAIASLTDPILMDAFVEAAMASGPSSDKAETYQSISLYAALIATLATLIAFAMNKPVSQSIGDFGDIAVPQPNPAMRNIGIIIVIAVIIFAVTSQLASHGGDSKAIMDVISDIMAASPVAFALFLLTFPAGLIALYLGQKFFHQRSILSLHTAAKRFRWFRVTQGFFLTWIVLGAFAFFAEAIGIIDINYVFDGGKFWVFAAVSLLFIPLQSATEEIVFRGYFNQGLTHLLKSKWAAFAVTSFAFMALHLSNPEALEGSATGTLPIVMSGYFFFGFAMCFIVWIDDGLETAIGIHAGNNCFAAVIMNYENSVLPTPSIFLTGTDPVKDSISTFLVLGVIVAIIWVWRGGPKNHDPSALFDKPSTEDA